MPVYMEREGQPRCAAGGLSPKAGLSANGDFRRRMGISRQEGAALGAGPRASPPPPWVPRWIRMGGVVVGTSAHAKAPWNADSPRDIAVHCRNVVLFWL